MTQAVVRALDWLGASPLPRILFVTHAFTGGVYRHVHELARAVQGRAVTLLASPAPQGRLALELIGADDPFALYLDMDRDWEAFVGLLRSIGIDRLHLHHVHGWPPAVLDLPQQLGCAHDVTLHDYFPVCAEYHLTAGGGFCGGERDCRRCEDVRASSWPWSLDEWRQRHGDFLVRAQRVIAPSQDCAHRIHTHHPAVTPVVWPHPQADAKPTRPIVRVLVPGGISPAKGIDVLEACARDARERDLPLHFRVLGFLARPIPHWPELPLSVAGEFPEGRLPELLALEHGDVVFFPAQCAETFSYTLSDALGTALPIVATDLGALPERLARRDNARLVRATASAREMNDVLLAAAGPQRGAWAPGTSGAVERYAQTYLECLSRSAAPSTTRPTIRSEWLVAPVHVDPPTTTLAWLYDDAVLCGKADSHAKLRRRTAEADPELAQLPELRRRADDADRRLAEIHASTSWRITAPLRRLVTWLRRPK